MAVEAGCGAGGSGASDPVQEGLAMVGSGLSAVLAGAGSLTLTSAQRREAVVELSGLRSTAEAAHLALLRAEVDATVVRDGRGVERAQRTVKQWLSRATGIGAGRARQDVENAALTDPDRGGAPKLGAALAAGAVTRQHLDVARAALKRIPIALRGQRQEELDALLTDHARTFCPADAAALAKHLLATVAPDTDDREDPHTFERRSLTMRTDSTGMVVLSGQLDRAGGAQVKTVVEALASPARRALLCQRDADGDPGSERETEEVTDLRTRAQRLADAVPEMARLAAAYLGLRTTDRQAPEAVHVTVHAAEAAPRFVPRATSLDEGDGERPPTTEPCHEPSPEPSPELEPEGGAGSFRAPFLPAVPTCEATGPLSTGTFQRLLCDAVMDKVVLDRDSGKVLRMESVARYATRAMRRALGARDGGCAWPGCTAPAPWCDAHHIVWWSRGGRTVIANLVLLCGHHHTMIYQEEWEIVVQDEVPWFRPPPWVDPARTLLRNPHRQARINAEALGREIAADLAELHPPRRT